jgi:hypothetical protein
LGRIKDHADPLKKSITRAYDYSLPAMQRRAIKDIDLGEKRENGNAGGKSGINDSDRPASGMGSGGLEGTLAISGAVLLFNVARYQNPLQANGSRGVVGDFTAVVEHGGVLGFSGKTGESAVRRFAVSDIYFCRVAPVVIFFERRDECFGQFAGK